MTGLRSLLNKLRSSRWYVVSLGNLSITWRLTISLVLAMLVFSVIGISVSYLIGRQQILNKVEQQADERVAMLATTLGIPLWNFAYDEVEHIAQAHVADVLVSGVTIVDLSGTVVFSAGEEYETATVSRVSKIYHKGQEIGYVEMTLAADYPMELNQQFLLLTSLVVLINLACLVVAIMFLMPRLIRRPIERIIEIANRYGSGKYDVSQKEVTAAEFRPVISALGTMANEIQSQVLELQRSEENFRHSLDNSPLGIRIITTEGELLYANQAVLDIYGYSSVEELKATPTKQHYTPKSYAEHQMRKAKRKKGEPVPSGYEVSIVHKDGEIRHLLVSRKAVIWNGEVQFQAIYQDITDRKQAEEDIRRAAEEWRTTFDSITDSVFICDKDFTLIRVNKAFADAVKMKPEELIGKPCYEIVHETNEPLPNCPHKVTIETKKSATAEFFEPHLGIHLEMTTSPIFNENGEVVSSVHLMRDITERTRMEEQLIVTDRLASIGELASGIAHELNNPLTSVIGFSELLLDRDLPDDVKEDIKVVNREAQRTAGVVRNLLAFARKHEAEKKPVDIHNIIQKVLQLRAYEQKVSNIEVNTQFAADLPEITADGFQLQQVFINIIINAEHFMTEAHGRGTFTITTERVGDIIRASFADDGPGIAKENLGHLFDPFFTTKEVGKGTGLGLSISHGIVTEHGGRIYAESELGKGATFIVELPISKQ